jgi:glycosyltransferase involved in cell wall biosynthesis
MTRPVRVCLVGPSLDILGGQAVAAERLRQRLQGLDGVTVDFLAVNPRLPGPLRLMQRVKYLRTVVTSIAYVASLLLRTWRYDVLHVFSASYWSFLLAPTPAILVGRLFGRAVILNYRSGEADDHLTRHGKVALPIMRLASVIVAPSDYLVGVFARHGLPARAILNFVEMERFQYRERRTPCPRFFSNRNFESLYGVDDVIRAFGVVQATVPAAELTLVGDGSERPMLKRLVQELGLRNVRFAGRVAPSDMPAQYEAADIYLNASRIDNMPQSILEAYASGTAVVTTDAGGIPFILRHEQTGLMAPVGDWKALGEAALRLLTEPGLAFRLASAGYRECEAKYSGEANVLQWRTLYQSQVQQEQPAA